MTKFKYRYIFIVIIVVIIVLLIRACGVGSNVDDQLDQPTAEEVIKNPNIWINANIRELIDLLKRADYCSQVWFAELDLMIARFEDQKEMLENDIDIHNEDEILELHLQLLNQLIVFREEQGIEQIDMLEKVLIEYQNLVGDKQDEA